MLRDQYFDAVCVSRAHYVPIDDINAEPLLIHGHEDLLVKLIVESGEYGSFLGIDVKARYVEVQKSVRKGGRRSVVLKCGIVFEGDTVSCLYLRRAVAAIRGKRGSAVIRVGTRDVRLMFLAHGGTALTVADGYNLAVNDDYSYIVKCGGLER